MTDRGNIRIMAWINEQVKIDMEKTIPLLKERGRPLSQQQYIEQAIKEKNEREKS